MSGLSIQYSQEIAKELTKIAVVLPGEELEIGQIIHFPFGKKGIWPFRSPAPKGAFSIITSLSELNINTEPTPWNKDSDSYIFSSRNSVKSEIDLGAKAKLHPNAKASTKMQVSFQKEGAVYFAAIDCERTDLLHLQNIQVDLEQFKNKIIWNETFLVTSITRAKRALIMQSSSNTASLSITGEVDGLITEDIAQLGAETKIGVENFKEAAFLKPWSENVNIFMGLHRFTKKSFGMEPKIKSISNTPNPIKEEHISAKEAFIHSENDQYILEEVSPTEVLRKDDY